VLEADSLVHIWLGKGYEQSVLLLQILAIGYGANVMGGAASQTGAGIGRPEFDMKSNLLLIVVNPILSLMLVNRFGPAGAAAGTALSFLIAAGYLVWLFHRNYLANSPWAVMRDVYMRPVLSGTLATLAVLAFHDLAPSTKILSDVRYLAPFKVVLDILVFAPIYTLLLIAFGQMTTTDRNNLMGLLNFGADFLRHPFRERVKIYR
jgi:hypothetical protein